jgi:hypothetical protein
MATSDYEYKVLSLTDHLDKTSSADLLIEIEAKLGFDVQQVFSRRTGDQESVYALLRRPRKALAGGKGDKPDQHG